MKNIHNQNALHDSLLYARVRYLLWRYRNFSLAFIFLRTFEAIASPLNLESSWQPRYSTVSRCLMKWPTKDILISLKPLVFEKRMNLVWSIQCNLQFKKMSLQLKPIIPRITPPQRFGNRDQISLLVLFSFYFPWDYQGKIRVVLEAKLSDDLLPPLNYRKNNYHKTISSLVYG